jgi:soluble lytic murein transglycosylase-like protein
MAHKYTFWRMGLWVCVCGLVHVLGPTLVRADIYRYVDSQGTLHFSNVPTSPGYQLYISEGPNRSVRQPPSRYDHHISEAARRYGVPFSLIKAIIKAESDFDPYAVSRKGARGLMQIMPETARDVVVGDVFDPRENILGGVRYLTELLSQFRGNVPLALAAYNAGPTKVSSLGRVPRIRETQHFVRRVMEYSGDY